MATRLDPGQIQIRSVGGAPMQQVGVPQVDVTMAARGEAQYAGTLAQVLDRMSEGLFREAAQMRQAEGLEFVANNPITPQQLQAAKEGITWGLGGRGDMASLRRTGNVFDEAVRKARSLEVASHFEIEGRNELTKLLTDIQAGNATSEQVAQKIATMTNGYGKSLAQIDPDAAIKFRATMATHGNTVLNAAYEAEVKRVKAQRIAKFDADFDNGVRLLEATVTQQPEMLDQISDVFRRNILTQSVLLGDRALQTEYSTKFDSALRNAKVNAVTRHLTSDEFMANPEATLARIRNGDIGKLSPVLQQMIATDFDSVAKVTANYMVAVNQRESAAKQERDRIKREGERNAVNLLEQIFPLPEGDPRRQQLIGELVRLPEGSVPIGTLKDVLAPTEGRSDGMVLFNVTQGIFNNTITQPEQIWQMVNRGLSAKDAVGALKLLNSEDRRDQSELDRGISQLAGIPVIPGSVVVLDPKGEEFKRRSELQAQALDIQAQAAREGKVFTPRQILQQLETNLDKRRNSEAARQARQTLETVWEKKAGGKITRDSLPGLEKSDKLNKNELRTVRRLLDQAEGIAP
jgi:hypothetical protein